MDGIKGMKLLEKQADRALVKSVSKAICLADDQLDFIVSCLNPCVAHPQPDCIQYVIPVAFDLEIQLFKSVDSAVAGPPEPAFEFLCGLINVFYF